MNVQGLLQNHRFRLAVIFMAMLLAVIWTSEILTAGISQASSVVSDIGSVVCASIAAILLIVAWRKMSEREVSKRVWGFVMLGIVLWAVAEALWAFYELVLGIETPYPSIADVFWLAGYIPLYFALVLRYRSFQSGAAVLHKTAIAVFMLLYSGVLAAYVAKPILDNFDTGKLAESLTNVAYPLADWGLCALTIVIIFSLERGRLATVWRIFGAGILIVATADLLFFYATWNDLYYPGGQVNVLSGAIDGLFNVSYLIIGLAVYTYTILSESLPSSRISIVLQSLAKMEVLIFVNPQGRILSLSDNFMNLVHAPATKPYIGMDLARALGMEGTAARELVAKIVQGKSLSNHPIPVRDVSGTSKNAWLTSLMMMNEQARLDSIALVVRADPPPAGETEFPLHEDQRMLIDHYLAKTGTSRIEDDEAIRTYFLAQINLLYSLIQQYSGVKVGDKFLEHLSQTARLNNWQFFHSGQDITVPQDFHGQALRELLMPLLQEARDFTANVTDQRMVEQEMKSLDKNLTPETQLILDKYEFRAGSKTTLKTAAAQAA